MAIVFDYVSCNGWGTSFATIFVPEHKKAKVAVEFIGFVEGAELADVSDVQDIECDLYYVDDGSWEVVGGPEDKIAWAFNRDEQ